MSKKIDRATHGPSWAEIILGIVLSTALGVVLGAALLIIRPVVTAKELPKEPDPKAIYFIEGSRDSGKARQAAAKRTAFLQGQSVSVNEDELNTLAAAPAPAAAAPTKAGEAPPPPPPAQALAPGPLNFRIRDNALQIGTPVTVNAAGLGQKIIVQARGGFVKDGNKFVFRPDTLYVGSCPVQRLPFVSGYVQDKFLASQPIPEDLAAAWAKAADVKVEGNAVVVTMQ